MEVIPVIDLKNGRVVAARQGRRECYAPLVSTLTRATDPASVIDALLELCPFRTVYVADLDALMGCGSQAATVMSLAERYPVVRFWLDQGLIESMQPRCGPPNIVPVIGTESLGPGDFRRWRVEHGSDFILSLDFKDGKLLGSEFVEEACWPERIIVMTLARVGSGHGPDYARLADLRSQYPATQWVAAGGVRSSADLAVLRGMGIHATLVSSALHSGAITNVELMGFSNSRPL